MDEQAVDNEEWKADLKKKQLELLEMKNKIVEINFDGRFKQQSRHS